MNQISGCNDFSDNTIQPHPVHQTSLIEASVMFQSQWSHRKIEMELSNLLGRYDQTEFWSANRANMFRNFDADDNGFYITDHKAKKMVKDRHQMKNEKAVSVIQKLPPAKLELADDENESDIHQMELQSLVYNHLTVRVF